MDSRLGSLIGSDANENHRKQHVINIIGFPFDEGCIRNGGREGSKNGPDMFRKLMYVTGCVPNPETGHSFENVSLRDLGDVDGTLDYDEAHESLQSKVFESLSSDCITFVIGGSNDQSISNARALMDTLNQSTTLGVINLDAHLDVRPQKVGVEHSGSPFRMLLEDENFNKESNSFVEFAAQSHQCSLSHVKWILERDANTKIIWFTELERDSTKSIRERFVHELNTMNCDSVFVSFDIDCIASTYCSGVSCPSPIGLTANDALDICYEAGKNPKVQLIDVSEFNPNVEGGYNTAKLVALMFYYFVMGVSDRSKHAQVCVS